MSAPELHEEADAAAALSSDPAAAAIVRALLAPCVMSDRDIMVGAGDAIVALCQLMVRAGLATRAEITEAMRETMGQQIARDGDAHPMSKAVVAYVGQTFELPVFAGKPN